MHRINHSVGSVRLLAVLVLFLLTVQGTVSGAAQTTDATPVAETPVAADGIVEVDGMGVAAVPSSAEATPEATPDATPGSYPQQVALTRVTLEPGEGIESSRWHFGPSVLFVESGTICYELGNAHGAAIVLFNPDDLADNPPPPPLPEDAAESCAPPPPGCVEKASGCDLIAEGINQVIVHEGQSVTQSIDPLQFVERGYRNIGTDVAVIWISQLQTDPGNIAPCGGGCP